MKVSNNTDNVESDAFLRPFEWLTDSASVAPLIESAIAPFSDTPVRVLHVGSGSSILGEHILESESLGDLIQQVVNVDKDSDTLQKMEARWKSSASQQQDKLSFIPADFAGTDPLPFPDGHFHIAVDKSTLDCTLCSDSATAGLLSEVYRLLNPNGGTYILISFHHTDLLRPLLENLPGADWEVSHSVRQRQVEDLIGNNKSGPNSNAKADTTRTESEDDATRAGTWASGSFEPDEQYRRTVNVFVCRRRGIGHEAFQTDRETIANHVHRTNDEWFQQHNPMLTVNRIETIRKLFDESKSEAVGENGVLLYDLRLTYQILFTEEEREHLDYEFFLEDWEAWIANNKVPSLPKDKVSVETALAFLEEMQ